MGKAINLPDRNELFFTARQDELKELANIFIPNKAAKCAISGLSGMGKTEIATEYCYLYKNNYQFILWVTAEDEKGITLSYLNIAKELALTVKEDDKVGETILSVKIWLATNSNWLLVLDNLESKTLSLSNELRDYLPTRYQGHILITTVSATLGRFARIVPLDKMNINDGALLLLKRANFINSTNSLNDISKQDLSTAQQISKEVDGLPLAIDQAGAYIDETKRSLHSYLNLYQNQAAKLRNTISKKSPKHVSVSTTFSLAFDKVKDKSLIAANVLEACALLSSELIPEEIFTKTSSLLGSELSKLKNDELLLDETIATLLDYSLIKRNANSNSLSIHRLVQEVICDLMDDTKKELLARSLVKALAMFCSNDVNNIKSWPHYRRLLPNALRLFSLIENYNLDFEEAARLFHQTGLFCDRQALYNQSLRLYLMALSVNRKIFGDEDFRVAATLNNIGEVYRHQGNHSQALDSYQKALSIAKILPFDKDITISHILNNIGLIYTIQENYPEALQYLQEALALTKTAVGDFRLDNARTLNNIGEVHRYQKNYSEALQHYQEALNTYILLLGYNHPSVADVFNNLAITYDCQDEQTQALEYYNKALNIYKLVSGEVHPSTAHTLNNIGSLYLKQEKYTEALKCLFSAFNIIKLVLGESHPDTIKIFKHMYIVYFTQKHYERLLRINLKILTVVAKILEVDYLNVIQILQNLYTEYKKTNIETQVDAYSEEVLIIFEDLLSNNHYYLIEILRFQHELLLRLNKNIESEPLLECITLLETKLATTPTT